MSTFGIKIDLPVYERSFTAPYSRVERLSGVQYLLLKIIGTKSFRDMTWGDVMEILRIPEEVYVKIFQNALEDMDRQGVIEIEDETDLESEIGSMDFTPTGRQAFDMGVIATQIEDFKGTVAFTPWKASAKFANSSSLKASAPAADLSSKFANRPVDLIGMQAHIESEKSLYGVQDKDAQVFDIKFEENDQLGSKSVDLKLSLNEKTGEFEVRSNDLDDAFLKNNFSAETFIRSLPPEVFQFNNGLKVLKWRDSDQEWGNRTFYVPFDVKLESSDLVVINKGSCSAEGDVSYHPLEGCDLAIIKLSNLGYEYCFVTRPTEVTGHEGQENCHIAVRRSMDQVEINQLVNSLIEDVDVSNADGFAKALRLTEIIKNDSKSLDIAKEYLAKVPVCVAMKDLEKHSKKTWFKQISTILEEVLCDKGLDVQGVLRELQGTGIKLSGHKILQRLKTGSAEADILTADILSDVLRNPESAISEMELNEYLAESILVGRSPDFKSSLLASASNAAKLLQKLKSLFGVKTLSDYSFDLESYEPKDHGSIASDITTFSSDITKLKPVINKTSRFQEISGYQKLFDGVVDFFSQKKGDRSTGIELRVRLEKLLKNLDLKGDLDAMLKEAKDSNLISARDYELADSIRQYGNACAHESTLVTVDNKKIKSWTSLLDRLEGERSGGRS